MVITLVNYFIHLQFQRLLPHLPVPSVLNVIAIYNFRNSPSSQTFNSWNSDWVIIIITTITVMHYNWICYLLLAHSPYTLFCCKVFLFCCRNLVFVCLLGLVAIHSVDDVFLMVTPILVVISGWHYGHYGLFTVSVCRSVGLLSPILANTLRTGLPWNRIIVWLAHCQ